MIISGVLNLYLRRIDTREMFTCPKKRTYVHEQGIRGAFVTATNIQEGYPSYFDAT